MDPGVKSLIEIGDKLFAARPTTLWQALADNFNPLRADITTTRVADDEIGNGLMSSTPVLFTRELAESIAVNMRPRQANWFELHTSDEKLDKNSKVRSWMEWATGVTKRAMYDPITGFVRATKEADYDWVTFGQTVILPSINRDRTALLYQTFHLRDCAWSEGANGIVDHVQRKWTPTVRQLCQMFKGNVDRKVEQARAKEPERQINCRHIVLPRDNYIYPSKGHINAGDFISLFIDVENQKVMEEVVQPTLRYIIPRWATVPGSQFGRSPVTEIMLPDARTLQALTRIILEGGEKAVDPPIVASEEVFRSDWDVRSGGVTWADLEFDQKLQDKYAVLSPDKSGMPIGFQIAQALTQTLADGLYLNKIRLPPPQGREYTAYEIRKRLEEHVRDLAPLYDPVEEVYSAPLLNETFGILLQYKAFGPVQMMPEELRGADANFTFRSPLRDAEEELKAHRLGEGLQLVGVVAQFDPSMAKMPKIEPAMRDGLKGIGWPEDWLNPPEAIEAERAAIAQRKQMQDTLAAAGGGGAAAEAVGRGAQEVQKAIAGPDVTTEAA